MGQINKLKKIPVQQKPTVDANLQKLVANTIVSNDDITKQKANCKYDTELYMLLLHALIIKMLLVSC